MNRETDPDAKAFLQRHFQKHEAEMTKELERRQQCGHDSHALTSYNRGHSRNTDYATLLTELRNCVLLNSSGHVLGTMPTPISGLAD